MIRAYITTLCHKPVRFIFSLTYYRNGNNAPPVRFDIVKLTPRQLCYIEADRRGIHLTTLFAICNGLGVSLVEFVSYLDDSFTPSISSIEAPGATIG